MSELADFGEKQKLQFKLYKLLLEKYAETINEKEKRTIGEIKGLVNGEDLTVQAIIADFMPENYSFEKDYLETAEKVFNFVTTETSYIESDLNLNYWLSPKEILKEKIGDDEDLAVFLCALLTALGDEKAQIIITELDNLKTHATVTTEINGKFYILDPSQKFAFGKFSGTKEKALKEYNFENHKIKKFIYKFNSKEYEQFI